MKAKHRLIRALSVAAMSAVLLVACAGSDGASASSDPGSCGLSLGWKKNAAACDAWMAQHCCIEEQACAADKACATIVKCVNACPIPRQRGCTDSCGLGTAGISAKLTAIGTCSRGQPDNDQLPGEWP
jgi:hypothetical protein